MKKHLLIIIVLAACAKEKPKEQSSVVQGITDANITVVQDYLSTKEQKQSITPDKVEWRYKIECDTSSILDGSGTAYHWSVSKDADHQNRQYIEDVFLFVHPGYSKEFSIVPMIIHAPKVTQQLWDSRYNYCERLIETDKSKQ